VLLSSAVYCYLPVIETHVDNLSYGHVKYQSVQFDTHVLYMHAHSYHLV